MAITNLVYISHLHVHARFKVQMDAKMIRCKKVNVHVVYYNMHDI